MSEPTQSQWAAALLKRLGIHQTPGAVQALTGWANAEGGHWHNDARYNPLNTTQKMPGAQTFRSVGQGAADIGIYKNWQQGLDATVRTLRNGRYEPILRALASGNPSAVAGAIGQTPWGTGGGLVQKTIANTPRVAGVHAFGVSGASPPTSSAGPSRTTTSSRTVGGVDNSDQRRAALSTFLSQPGASADDNLSFALQMRALKDVPGQKVTTTTRTGNAAVSAKDASTGGTNLQSKLISRANALDRRNNAGQLPYQWGGGHAKKTSAYSGTPVDCSGAVSSVLGINPRVSGQFTKWGKPGEGGTTTIYANSHHVLMKIRGRDGEWHFFGTSKSNPGGGAGWIPASQISPEYLHGFSVRHI